MRPILKCYRGISCRECFLLTFRTHDGGSIFRSEFASANPVDLATAFLRLFQIRVSKPACGRQVQTLKPGRGLKEKPTARFASGGGLETLLFLLAVSDLAGSAASLSRNNSGGRHHGGRHQGALRNGERQTHEESLTLKNFRCKGKNSNVSARAAAKGSVRSRRV